MNMLPDDYMFDKESNRYSRDTGRINNNGIQLLDLCKQTGLRIFNGRVGNDKFQRLDCTFVGHRGSSLVDYILDTKDLLNTATCFDVSEPNILSDHCLISFSAQFDAMVNI